MKYSKKKYLVFLSFLFLSFFSSCKKSKNENLKSIDLKHFSITVPNTWEKKEFTGIDFRLDYLLTNEGDTIDISDDYEYYFNEAVQVFSKEQIAKYDSLNLNIKNLYYSKTPKIDQDQGTFLKEYYYYDTIDGYMVKKRVPKVIGKGIIALGIDGKRGNKIVIYSKNLPKSTHEKLLKAFRTIKIKIAH